MGTPPRVGVGLPVPTSDDVAASLGTRLRKWQRSLRWGGDHPVSCRDVAATASLDELAERVTQLEGVVEQIAGAPVPQILEGVDGLQHVPQERVQNSVVELIGCVPVPRIWEGPHHVPRELVQNRMPEQILDSPVPQVMEAVLTSVPRERVHNRTPE